MHFDVLSPAGNTVHEIREYCRELDRLTQRLHDVLAEAEQADHETTSESTVAHYLLNEYARALSSNANLLGANGNTNPVHLIERSRQIDHYYEKAN